VAPDSGRAVVVIGGGMAGLVAARELLLRGARVTVLERSAVFGGSVDGRTLGGFALDSGAESFSTRSATVAGSAGSAPSGRPWTRCCRPVRSPPAPA
jgi:oxygen-dependent protoporphyrinogen oxidase